MAAKRKPLPFKPQGPSGKPASGKAASGKQKGDKPASGGNVIPRAVANRMAVRIAIATGVPSVLGMAVFVASYLLVSRGIFDIPPVLTLATSGGCFLLGLVGLSYGVLSASWEDKPGSTLGFEQIGVNIPRLRASIRAMGQGSGSKTPPAG
ncbi:PAM68 family protein [Synechococcus sp. CS-603]|uniref:PAM68 family protein n=1 Tax=Synechococcus sp. CS-603 TaxID=2847981 RepID=UPI00223B4A69|nr:PAM68 family protein [Synechococcus sp. CS-603]MCT0201838.1 PAM68 family protein [Synechococcus sp. CS-603]